MEIMAYLRSPERLRKFRQGSRVEATRSAPEEYYGLSGEVIYVKRDMYPAMLVRWTMGERTPLPAKWRGIPRTERMRPEQLKLVEEELWDDYGDYPVPPEEIVEEPYFDQLDMGDYSESADEYLTAEDFKRRERYT